MVLRPQASITRSFSSLRPSTAASKGGFVQSLIHGTNEQPLSMLQHSKLVGRGKYVHELVKHRVLPSRRAEYRDAARDFYGALVGGSNSGRGELMGSWECVAGDLDSYIHIIRHDTLTSLTPTLLAEPPSALMSTLSSRESSLLQEFAFSPAHDNPAQAKSRTSLELAHGVEPLTDPNVFELRSYRLVPGSLLEWEAAWRKGIEARRQFVEPAGAWFTQVGHLHTVHHLWEFPSLAVRKEIRDQAWGVSGWADTVRDTVRLAKDMTSQIMVPMDWSPLK